MANLAKLMDGVWKATESQDWGALEAVFTPATEFRMPGQTLRGPHEFRAMCEAWWSAFPDLKHQIAAEMESGDDYSCELVMVGTHTGTMRTPKGDIPATGKRIQMLSCDYVKVKDGRIVSWHAYPDMMGMLAQLGVA